MNWIHNQVPHNGPTEDKSSMICDKRLTKDYIWTSFFYLGQYLPNSYQLMQSDPKTFIKHHGTSESIISCLVNCYFTLMKIG